MSFSGPLEDRIAIRELHDTYADASFRGDQQAWLDCWTEDCTWSTPFGELSGKAQLAEQWGKIDQAFGVIGFFAIVGAIEIDGDRAVTRGYVREIAEQKAGGLLKIVGRYDDELMREGGIWRFVRRAYSALIRETTE